MQGSTRDKSEPYRIISMKWLLDELRELPKINIPNLLAFLIVFFVASTVT